MSLRCRVSDVPLLLKTLNTVAAPRGGSWATVVFSQDVVIIHTAGENHSFTGTATIPRSLFVEYTVTKDLQFTVNVFGLIDALMLGGAHTVTSSAVRFTIMYPTMDDRVLVEVQDSHRVLQTTLVTRPVRERLLSLRFTDSLTMNRICMRGDAVADLISDLSAFQVETVRVGFTRRSFLMTGLRSVLGEVVIELSKHSELVMMHDVGDESLTSAYLMGDIALACSPQRQLRRGTVEGDSGFERVTLLVNRDRQLCVTHQGLDHVVPVMVSMVLNPQICLDDDADL
jgi:hypothetical protein